MFVHHTDAKREYAYDRNSHVGKLDKALDQAAANGWNSQVNNAAWGTDYLNRTASAKSNMWENAPNETKYIYRDFDSKGQPLDGHNNYTLTIEPGKSADFIVLNQNILEVPVEKIHETKVLKTVLQGHAVYQSE